MLEGYGSCHYSIIGKKGKYYINGLFSQASSRVHYSSKQLIDRKKLMQSFPEIDAERIVK